MDTPSQRADLVEDLLHVADEPSESDGGGLVIAGKLRALELELDGEDHESLLSAVVQVVLKTSALFVGLGQQPCTRRFDLVQSAADSCSQAVLLDRGDGQRRYGTEEL